jgi:hypothetical protein
MCTLLVACREIVVYTTPWTSSDDLKLLLKRGNDDAFASGIVVDDVVVRGAV